MKQSKTFFVALISLVAVSALYRIMPSRPMNFAPQIAIAIFSGALFIKNKKWAFALPLLSMLISDILYEILYQYNLSSMKGFYGGQFFNYLLFTALTAFGFIISKLNLKRILTAAISAPVFYFIVSNFAVWLTGTGFQRPKTFSGLIMCYTDALPFFPNTIYSTLLFSALFFGVWMFVRSKQHTPAYTQQ